jgi:hypothetical protein
MSAFSFSLPVIAYSGARYPLNHKQTDIHVLAILGEDRSSAYPLGNLE